MLHIVDMAGSFPSKILQGFPTFFVVSSSNLIGIYPFWVAEQQNLVALESTSFDGPGGVSSHNLDVLQKLNGSHV